MPNNKPVTPPGTAALQEGSESNAPGNSAASRSAHRDDGMTTNDDAVQQAIGSQLRAVYDEVVRLPVPDRFLSLLSSLDTVTADAGDPGRETDN